MYIVNFRTRKTTLSVWDYGWCTIICALLLALGASAQQGQRFPSPLGLNKVLSGVISKAKIHADTAKDTQPRYILTTKDGSTYQLRGREKELKRLVGKKARITGNAVGETVTIDSIARIRE